MGPGQGPGGGLAAAAVRNFCERNEPFLLDAKRQFFFFGMVFLLDLV